jgi:hypothetical protein
MTAGLKEPNVSKKKRPPEGAGPPAKTTTKVEAGLLRKANIVAIHRGLDLYDYLDGVLRPAVERDYARMIADEAAGT